MTELFIVKVEVNFISEDESWIVETLTLLSFEVGILLKSISTQRSFYKPFTRFCLSRAFRKRLRLNRTWFLFTVGLF